MFSINEISCIFINGSYEILMYLTLRNMNPIGTRIFAAFFTLFLITSCSQPPRLSQSRTISRDKELSRMVKELDDLANTGVLVEDLNSGEILLSYRPDQLFTPASNVKVLTAAAALNFLGKDFNFSTTVHASEEFPAKHNNWLALKGSGDPFLSPDQIFSLADFLSYEVKRIDTLIIDATIFDEFYYGPGWMWDEGSHRNASPVGGLNLNRNTVDLIVTHQSDIGGTEIEKFPDTRYITVIDNIIFINDSIDFIKMTVEREWWKNSNTVLTQGRIFEGDLPDTLHTNIYDPAAYTGIVFREALEKRDVSVGVILFTPMPSSGKLVAEMKSSSLPEMTKHFLKETDNLVAEALLKRFSIDENNPTGSWVSGIHKMNRFMAEFANLDTSAFRVADGSGLSRYNLLSPLIMVTVLKSIFRNKDFADIIIPALPVSGTDGTLRERMTDPAVKGKVMAKTGSLSNVSTLSGYIDADSGHMLVFSMMMNGFTVDTDRIREMQDQICRYMAENF